MQIKISNVHDRRREGDKQDLTFRQSQDVRGDLEIVFGEGDCPEIFTQRDANIPLFVAETRLFMDRLKVHGHGVWRMFFAPFAKGKVVDGKISILRGDGEIIDVLSKDEGRHLEQHLASLAQTYGCLRPSPDRLRWTDYGDS